MEAHGISEGFNVGTRAFRNNNPGNLAFSNLLSQKFGALLEPPNIKGERRFAYFPTLEKGVAGKADYIVRISNGQHTLYPKDPSKTTLEVYIYKYAPPKQFLSFIILTLVTFNFSIPYFRNCLNIICMELFSDIVNFFIGLSFNHA